MLSGSSRQPLRVRRTVCSRPGAGYTSTAASRSDCSSLFAAERALGSQKSIAMSEETRIGARSRRSPTRDRTSRPLWSGGFRPSSTSTLYSLWPSSWPQATRSAVSSRSWGRRDGPYVAASTSSPHPRRTRASTSSWRHSENFLRRIAGISGGVEVKPQYPTLPKHETPRFYGRPPRGRLQRREPVSHRRRVPGDRRNRARSEEPVLRRHQRLLEVRVASLLLRRRFSARRVLDAHTGRRAIRWRKDRLPIGPRAWEQYDPALFQTLTAALRIHDGRHIRHAARRA